MKAQTQRFLSRLEGVKDRKGGTEWSAMCPIHGGSNPHLDIAEGEKGVVAICRTCGVDGEDVCRALKIDPQELFWDQNGSGHGAGGATPPKKPPPRRPPVSVHPYPFADGRPLIEVRRYETPHPDDPIKKPEKDCIPFTWVDGDWVMGLKADPPLYGLPELAAASVKEIVAWVEGEKCADALKERGFVATTALGGTGRKNHLPDVTPLKGRRVAILPDEDSPGVDYAKAVLRHLTEHDIEAWIVPPLPHDKPETKTLFDGFDVANWFEIGHQGDELRPLLRPPPPKNWDLLYSVPAFLALPPPVWQIEGMIEEGSLVGIDGIMSHAKTFFTTEMGMALSLGKPWCGKTIHKPGPVVYVNADGGKSYQKRIDWWCLANGQKPPDFFIYHSPVLLSDESDFRTFMTVLRYMDRPPVGVYFDTYSRCIPGADENGQAESSLAVARLDMIRHEFGATTFLLHHLNADGKWRGSNVVPGAIDTLLKVQKAGALVTVSMDKQRNGEEFEPLSFTLERIAGTNAAYLKHDPHAGPILRPACREKAGNKRRVVFALQSATCPMGIEELREETGVAASTLYRYLDELVREKQAVALPRTASPEGGRPRDLWRANKESDAA